MVKDLLLLANGPGWNPGGDVQLIYLFLFSFFELDIVKVMNCFCFLQCSNNMLAFISCYLQIQSTFTSSVDLFLK